MKQYIHELRYIQVSIHAKRHDKSSWSLGISVEKGIKSRKTPKDFILTRLLTLHEQSKEWIHNWFILIYNLAISCWYCHSHEDKKFMAWETVEISDKVSQLDVTSPAEVVTCDSKKTEDWSVQFSSGFGFPIWAKIFVWI